MNFAGYFRRRIGMFLDWFGKDTTATSTPTPPPDEMGAFSTAFSSDYD